MIIWLMVASVWVGQCTPENVFVKCHETYFAAKPFKSLEECQLQIRLFLEQHSTANETPRAYCRRKA